MDAEPDGSGAAVGYASNASVATDDAGPAYTDGPVYKLSVGLINTYKHINEVRCLYGPFCFPVLRKVPVSCIGVACACLRLGTGSDCCQHMAACIGCLPAPRENPL